MLYFFYKDVALVISFLSYHATGTECYLAHLVTELKMDSSFHHQMELIQFRIISSKFLKTQVNYTKRNDQMPMATTLIYCLLSPYLYSIVHGEFPRMSLMKTNVGLVYK